MIRNAEKHAEEDRKKRVCGSFKSYVTIFRFMTIRCFTADIKMFVIILGLIIL